MRHASNEMIMDAVAAQFGRYVSGEDECRTATVAMKEGWVTAEKCDDAYFVSIEDAAPIKAGILTVLCTEIFARLRDGGLFDSPDDLDDRLVMRIADYVLDRNKAVYDIIRKAAIAKVRA